MQNLRGRARIAIVSSMLCGWAFLAYACSAPDENPGSPRKVGTDSGSEGSVDPQGTGDASLGAPICGKYGGYENVKTITNAIITRVAADCRISSPIATLNADQSQHLAECLQIQIGGAFQCPGISYIANTTKDSKGNKCRDMTSAHKGLNLRNADFNAFVEDVSAELAAKGVSPDDIRAIAPVFEGTRTGVVQTNSQPDRNTHCTCADGLYMGKPCLPEAGILEAGTDAADAADAADGG
jgi:hypothetical protein